MSTSVVQDEYIFTISEINQQVKGLLEQHFPSILVTGELTNFSVPRSGHWYFTLKDDAGQIKAAMFRFRNQTCRFTPKEGDQVIARAKLSLYAPRGDYQLIVDAMQPAGLGALQAAFDALKEKLLAEGLFEADLKKPLPRWPKGVCVITSGTGAALHDILHVLARRFPALPVTVIPVPVQGAESAPAIVHALSLAEKHSTSDVIILARGGGSLEDLWSFNDETVARAIFRCQKPIVSGVGHETDFTIADFVADVRAPTPSAAAELISPNQDDLRHTLARLIQRAQQAVYGQLYQKNQTLKLLHARLKHPRHRLEELQQTVDRLEIQLSHAFKIVLQQRQLILQRAMNRLYAQHPRYRLDAASIHLKNAQQRLLKSLTHNLSQRQTSLESLAQQMHLISPLATLDRGYSLTLHKDTGTVIRTSRALSTGDTIRTRLSEGEITSTVLSIHNDLSVKTLP